LKGRLPAAATDMSRRKEANFVTPIKKTKRHGAVGPIEPV
jgi:hypothetical protein